MVAILSDAIKSGGLGTLHYLPDELIEEIVEETFTEARAKYISSNPHGDGLDVASSVDNKGGDDIPDRNQADDLDEDVITYEMYEKMVYENNDIIKWLAIDLSRVTQMAKLILSDKATIKNIS